MNSANKFLKNLKQLFNQTVAEQRHTLAILEITKGEKARKEIEFELNMLKRNSEYKKEAENYFGIADNIDNMPNGFDTFPAIKKNIFRLINNKIRKKRASKLFNIDDNEKKIEKLLLYRIQHEKGRYSAHLIPNDGSITGLTAEISMEVDRLFNIFNNMTSHHSNNPTSLSYGMSYEEKEMLKRIKDGFFDKKISAVKKQEKKIKRKKQTVKAKISELTKEDETNIAKEKSKELWYRKEKLDEKTIAVLKKIGYQESDINHLVYDFSGKRVSCLGFKPGGFKHNKYRADRRESLHHFSRPYLLKEISPSTKILERIGNERTVDAVMTVIVNGAEEKAAIEFQESHSLGADRIAEKLQPILEKYDYIIIVCQDKFKHVYEKNQHEKLFVVNNGEFNALLKKFNIL
ncbi:MAG: hypothetical protein V1859_02255 [archaeon]